MTCGVEHIRSAFWQWSEKKNRHGVGRMGWDGVGNAREIREDAMKHVYNVEHEYGTAQ